MQNIKQKHLLAISEASKAAHLAALNAIRQLYHKDETESEASIEFEVDRDFVEFYKKSLEYKIQKKNEEKERLQQVAEGYSLDYAVGEQVKCYQKATSIRPPLEMASMKREEELYRIYGVQAKQIEITETQLQMDYDRNLDIYQPVYWPSLPLKL